MHNLSILRDANIIKCWSDKEIIVSSSPISFEEYCESGIPFEVIVNVMMGDLQRIDIYGKNGFQVPQEIPEDVWAAFYRLKEAGFTKHLLNEV
jgi:hypothetical protein